MNKYTKLITISLLFFFLASDATNKIRGTYYKRTEKQILIKSASLLKKKTTTSQHGLKNELTGGYVFVYF